LFASVNKAELKQQARASSACNEDIQGQMTLSTATVVGAE